TGVKDAGSRYPMQLRITCSAGEPLNPEVIRWFREQFGLTVLDYYGLTESYPLCGNFPTVEVREGSMGRPVPGWDVRVLDEDENAEEIKLFVRERHSAYAYPREVEFVADLPKTLTGKIRRIELREAEREKKGAHAPA